jgi:GR25 family glycosyltransferase involved in LPS biosynthesis
MTLPRQPYAQASALQIACLASHLAALDCALRDGEAAFLIMEDDIRLAFDVDHAALLESAPRSWEILQLYVVNAERVEQMHEGGYRQQQLWQPWQGANFSTGAYLCSRRGARRILQRFRRGARFDFAASPHPLIADHFLYRVARTFTLTYPLYIENGAFGSTLGSEADFHAASRAAIRRIWQASPAPPFASRRDALPES